MKFSNEITFDQKSTIVTTKNYVEKLVNSPLLQADQKYSILNSSISPKLIYPFQTTPISKIPQTYLHDLDKILRSCLKEILQLPLDVPDSMLYSDRKYKGLGLFCATWEARLQRINACNILKAENNPYLNSLKDFQAECSACLQQLHIEASDKTTNIATLLPDARKIREQLREREFNRWSELPHKGKGVPLFKEHTPTNKWVRQHRGLSCSEWKDALKMISNVVAVRSVPGRSGDNTLCRRCGREHETLAHVLGSCPFGDVLRNGRHHTIRHMIANELRSKGLKVYEEVSGLATNGSSRRIDIIAFKPSSKTGIILDPTIRFETHSGQPEEVDKEKKTIYEPTIPYYQEKYNLDNISVTGLMLGARGTIPNFFVKFWSSLNLNKSILYDLSVTAIRGSVLIMRNHLYSH